MAYNKEAERLSTGQIDRYRRVDVAKPQDAAKSIPAKPAWTARRVLKAIAAVLKGAGKPALLAALGLIVVWCLGRIMEAIHGSAVFDITLTYWLGLVIFILLALWVIGSGTAAFEDFGKARDKRLAVISWFLFGALVFTVFLGLKGYRISSEGLFAAVAGSAENSRQSTFLLFKFHSLNPMLPLNLAASKLMGAGWDMESLTPYVWSWNVLFAFFIWSLAYGIVILMQKDKRGAKSVHLFFAAFALLILIILKSVSRPTVEQMMVIQAAAAILLVFQVLLTYATLRAAAAGVDEETQKSDPFWSSATEKEPAPQKRFIGLPPSATALVLALFLIVPILADLHNRFLTAHSSNRVVQHISANQAGSGPQLVAVTALSIRSGPANGDDVLGILPKGKSVQVLDKIG
jgi:hypothetical protein